MGGQDVVCRRSNGQTHDCCGSTRKSITPPCTSDCEQTVTSRSGGYEGHFWLLTCVNEESRKKSWYCIASCNRLVSAVMQHSAVGIYGGGIVKSSEIRSVEQSKQTQPGRQIMPDPSSGGF
ncbi:unnamed protein product [Protopolystoma xenopodis]|uniref:Uncharacterized protein n=1 Tax=Protopolystoma xenopodis TaxID=117903 RepID=A0A448XMN4_9PLAT|nr:unnamed protein product [Protopolystoma xenopodis]